MVTCSEWLNLGDAEAVIENLTSVVGFVSGERKHILRFQKTYFHLNGLTEHAVKNDEKYYA